MNKQKLISIIQGSETATNDDIKALQKVGKQYPYSQVVHSVLARHHHQTKSASAKSAIQVAAIYATDRAVLKHFVETKLPVAEGKTSVPQEKTLEPTEQKEAVAANNIKAEVEKIPISSGITDIDAIRNSIFKNLEELKVNMKPYASDTSAVENPRKAAAKRTTKKATDKSVKKEEVKAQKSPAKKKESTSKAADKPSTQSKTARKKSTSKPKDTHQLIDDFIKKAPEISKKKPEKSDETKNQEDLSKTNVELTEDFASENLAQILIKQGNKGKAIEIYKKLIWKFPQKKAYFASQIEALK